MPMRDDEFAERTVLALEKLAAAQERQASAWELLAAVAKLVAKTSDKSIFEHIFGKPV